MAMDLRKGGAHLSLFDRPIGSLGTGGHKIANPGANYRDVDEIPLREVRRKKK
jgi:hypothetical protein